MVTYACALNPERRPAAYAMVLSALLAAAANQPHQSHREASARLLELANADQRAFRSVVKKLSFEQSELMQKIIREGSGLGRKAEVSDSDEREPTITLKMDF